MNSLSEVLRNFPDDEQAKTIIHYVNGVLNWIKVNETTFYVYFVAISIAIVLCAICNITLCCFQCKNCINCIRDKRIRKRMKLDGYTILNSGDDDNHKKKI